MRSSLVVVAAEAAETQTLSPLGFGLLTFGILMTLLVITFAFRSVGTRHRNH